MISPPPPRFSRLKEEMGEKRETEGIGGQGFGKVLQLIYPNVETVCKNGVS